MIDPILNLFFFYSQGSICLLDQPINFNKMVIYLSVRQIDLIRLANLKRMKPFEWDRCSFIGQCFRCFRIKIAENLFASSAHTHLYISSILQREITNIVEASSVKFTLFLYRITTNHNWLNVQMPFKMFCELILFG